MKAVKENKVYTLTNEQEAEFYRLKGFDILDDDGNILKYGAGKTKLYRMRNMPLLRQSLKHSKQKENQNELSHK